MKDQTFSLLPVCVFTQGCYSDDECLIINIYLEFTKPLLYSLHKQKGQGTDASINRTNMDV